MNEPIITTVEDACHAFSQPLSNADMVQAKIERLLDYLQDEGVIDGYRADRLDWLFGPEQSN